MNAYGQKFTLTSTSPSSPTTEVGKTIEGLADYKSLLICTSLQGGTGGVLDVYLQVSPDPETVASRRWVSKARYAQLAAGAAATTAVIGLSRGEGSGTAPIAASYATDTTVWLGANTVVPGDFGKAMRVVYAAGASTSAGASQTIEVYASV